MEKRLYRSKTNKVLAGVCGGMGEYFGLDPNIIRLLAVLLFFAKGLGLLVYIAAWILIPLRPEGEEADRAAEIDHTWGAYLPGVLLIGLGLVLLMREFWYWFDWDIVWPVLFIIGGVAVILYGRRNSRRHDVPQRAREGNHQNGGAMS